MLEYNSIMKRIKRKLYEKTGDRIYDKDLAKALGFKASYYAVIKRRQRIPFEAITLFAFENDVSLDWIFLGRTT